MPLDDLAEAGGWPRFLAPAALLWVTASIAALRIGHPAAWRLVAHDAASGWAEVVAIIAGIAGVTLGAVLLADVTARLLRRLWLGAYLPPPVSGLLRRQRAARWESADRRAAQAQSQARRHRLEAARNRVALARPQSPTWIGDRMAALETRVRNEYGLDLPSAWPRLWLVLPESSRADLRRASRAYTDASRWGAWSVIYAVTALAWWPLAGLAVIALASAVQSGRAAAAAATDLAEAAVDLNGTRLAARLGLPASPGPLEPDVGRRINARNRRSA